MFIALLLVWMHVNNDIRIISTIFGYVRKIFWSIFKKNVFTLDCHLDNNWNQLKPKHLDTSGKEFSSLVIIGDKIHSKSRSHILVGACIKGHGRKKDFRHFIWLPSFSHGNYLSCCWGIPSLVLEPTSLGCQNRLKTSWYAASWNE